MFELFFLWMAYRILKKHRGYSPEFNGKSMVLVSNGFYTWLFNEGYDLYKEKQYILGDPDYVKCQECGDIYCATEVQPHTGLCYMCNPPF